MRFFIIVFFTIIFSSFCYEKDGSEIEKARVDYDISINESFQLDLNSNPSTGYSWNWINKPLVTIVDTFNYAYTPDLPVIIGSGGKEVWKFKGINYGIDTIKLEYCRSWNKNSTIYKKNIVVRVK